MSERLATVALSGAPPIRPEVWRRGRPGALEFLLRLDGITPDMNIHEAVAQMGVPKVPQVVYEQVFSPTAQSMYDESHAPYEHEDDGYNKFMVADDIKD